MCRARVNLPRLGHTDGVTLSDLGARGSVRMDRDRRHRVRSSWELAWDHCRHHGAEDSGAYLLQPARFWSIMRVLVGG